MYHTGRLLISADFFLDFGTETEVSEYLKYKIGQTFESTKDDVSFDILYIEKGELSLERTEYIGENSFRNYFRIYDPTMEQIYGAAVQRYPNVSEMIQKLYYQDYTPPDVQEIELEFINPCFAKKKTNSEKIQNVQLSSEIKEISILAAGHGFISLREEFPGGAEIASFLVDSDASTPSLFTSRINQPIDKKITVCVVVTPKQDSTIFFCGMKLNAP